MFPGISDRMQKELTALSPASMRVNCRVSCTCHDTDLVIIFRSKLWPLLSGNTLSGLGDRFWPPSTHSRTCGVRSKSTMNLALPSFTAVRHIQL